MDYLISYDRNPMYYGKWGLYAGIYLIILLFTLLIRKIQRIQIEKRILIEKKITELQLKIVRNQMDPHFTMNAINSVIDAVNRQENEEAGLNLVLFSKMYRSLVLSADKIKRTLKEEIDFTENYLALERFRFRKKFDFTIVIDPKIDLQWEVPKMVIQSPVENAVKHGLYNKPSGGKIAIQAFVNGNILVLSVQDNGIGRDLAAQSEEKSTGMGTQIMDQFLGLYYTITGKKVTLHVEDLYDPGGNPCGTKVIIQIPMD
jgi:LytS/YehU family sensor histidine kinase